MMMKVHIHHTTPPVRLVLGEWETTEVSLEVSLDQLVSLAIEFHGISLRHDGEIPEINVYIGTITNVAWDKKNWPHITDEHIICRDTSLGKLIRKIEKDGWTKNNVIIGTETDKKSLPERYSRALEILNIANA